MNFDLPVACCRLIGTTQDFVVLWKASNCIILASKIVVFRTVFCARPFSVTLEFCLPKNGRSHFCRSTGLSKGHRRHIRFTTRNKTDKNKNHVKIIGRRKNMVGLALPQRDRRLEKAGILDVVVEPPRPCSDSSNDHGRPSDRLHRLSRASSKIFFEIRSGQRNRHSSGQQNSIGFEASGSGSAPRIPVTGRLFGILGPVCAFESKKTA